MTLFLTSLVSLAVSAAAALLAGPDSRLGAKIAAFGAVLAAAAGIAAAATAVSGGQDLVFSAAWSVPGGAFSLALDPLSAFFLIPLFLLSALAAVYAVGYLDKKPGAAACLFNLLTLSMAVVFAARNAVLFLIAWELMALFSFLLVVWDYENAESRRAGWIYLTATHIGTAFLFALFGLAWHECGSAEFAEFPRAFAALPFGAVAALAVLGFGTKAGFFPLHVWLPKAHPAAPSHVSAIMSGVMIKTGIYGIIRIISLCPPAPAEFGWLLLAIGAVSGVLGVLFALAQHDLKQLLAYHSVENIGIIAIGLGVGYLGLAAGRQDIAFLGFAGGILHVANHALFKGLLFLAAGSVYHAGGTRDMEKLGGLQRLMPMTAGCFFAGSAAISGLPPLNGFISELLIYIGAFKLLGAAGGMPLAGLLAITALALIGGLAAACFIKAFSVTFLGLPRAALGKTPHESPSAMLLPMFALALLCAAGGLFPALFMPLYFPAAAALSGGLPPALAETAPRIAGWAGVTLLAVSALVWILRNALLAGRKNAAAPTWGCGYSAPTPRMQYTASSFAQPVLALFGLATQAKPVTELFPKRAVFSSHTPDPAKTRLFSPIFGAVESSLSVLRKIQHGNIHAYVLYIAAALAGLLWWALR